MLLTAALGFTESEGYVVSLFIAAPLVIFTARITVALWQRVAARWSFTAGQRRPCFGSRRFIMFALLVLAFRRIKNVLPVRGNFSVATNDAGSVFQTAVGIAIINILAGCILWILLESVYLVRLLPSMLLSKARYEPSAAGDHVIVCGDLKYENLARFYCGFFRLSSCAGKHIVVLSLMEPSDAVRELMQGRDVTWIYGSEMLESDLERVAIDKAAAAFVFGEHRTGDDEQESAAVMRCLSLRFSSPRIPLFVACTLAETKRRLQELGGVVHVIGAGGGLHQL